jgi:cephalosporin-C deacetylase-like acetyl esterase
LKKRNLSTVSYFDLIAQDFEPKYRFKGQNKNDFAAWKQELLPQLQQLLGPMPESVELNPEIMWEVEVDGLIQRKVLLDVEKHMSMTALLYLPKNKNKRLPAVLCNHGHGTFAKDSVMGIRSDFLVERNAEIKGFNYDFGLQMAKRGYVTIAIDFRGFGERGDGGKPYPGRDACNVNFIRGSLMGYNLLTLDIWDAMKAIDYLCTIDCVDPERIGAMGISFGGTVTAWVSMLDERIKAADIICYSARFKNFAVHDANFCGSQYLPGLYALCDVPDLHGLIAPRPLLAEVGVYDKCFCDYDSLSCSREAAKIFEAAGVPEKYEVDVFAGDHKFAGNKAFRFFDTYLKGQEWNR